MQFAGFSACLAVFLGTALTGSVLAADENSGKTNQPPTNPDPQHLVWIKSGTFTMGSSNVEADRQENEGPQTQVTISRGFWMSKHETTQGEYQSVMGTDPSFCKGDTNRPVESVSWVDATNYCGKLTARQRSARRLPSGYEYRLPTAAEAEYACRAGTTTRFGYGDDPGYSSLGSYAWYRENSHTASKPSGVSFEKDGRYHTTHPVGQKKPNAWGLYDMHGNVFEWCLDWADKYPGGSVTDPRGSNTGSFRVVRGGGWLMDGGGCRSAAWYGFPPEVRGMGIGFRPVLAPGQ